MVEGVYQWCECLSWVLAVWKRLLFCVRDGRVGLNDGFPLLRLYLPGAGFWAGNCDPVRRFGRIGRCLERRSAYALIAAINGPGPMMFMTRLRL